MNPWRATIMSRIWRRGVLGTILFALLVCITNPIKVQGQTTSAGTVTGTVTDKTPAAVTGATVALVDTSTNDSRTTTTNDRGTYIFNNVPPGTYTVTITKSGFRTVKFSNQVVAVGQALTLNYVMEVGAIGVAIEVTANGSELQTMNATVGNTVGNVMLSGLPAIGGDVSTFMTLQPGVGPDGSVAGAVMDQSTFMLDGGNNTNDMDGSMTVYTPSFGGDPTGGIAAGNGLRGGASAGGVPTGVMPTPADSVEEFKVNSAGQTADFNTSAGAQTMTVTRRGSNQWHGSAYEYYLDNKLNANSWDNNSTGTALPSFHYNRIGGSVGGPLTSKSFLGGKTYFFAMYQGFRWNNSVSVERITPSAAMRVGILRFSNTSGVKCNATSLANCTIYNLNPTPTVDPVSGATIPGSTLDPRGIGINSKVVALWNLMPKGNDTACTGVLGTECDTVNEIGFRGNMSVPQDDDFGVFRLDHDFGSKWHFYVSYRDYRLTRLTNSQINIASGTPVSTSSRPQQPWFLVGGLTTNVSSNVTNDFHYSYLRNFWAWADAGGAPQLAGLGGALEPFGETANALTPYNVNTQSIRTRFWDGHDNYLRDDITILHGSHLFSFGGTYERNWDYHQRSDNGGGINYFPTYQLGDSSGAGLMSGLPTAPAGVTATTWGRDYAAVLGIVSDSQTVYTRQGPNLTLNPPLTYAFDKSTIPYYNVYWTDTWRMKRTFTLTYGLGYALEMPPTEANGKQINLVDTGGNQLDIQAYMNQRQNAALQGQVYNPILGFDLVGNTGSGNKYPYMPFYGSFSPRVAAAWNPNFDSGIFGKVFGDGKTVFRAGYSRIFGRVNGVGQVLVPLLGTGLIQAVQCRLPNMNGTCGGTITPSNAFRIGTDGLVAPLAAASPTLPQPTFPGINSVGSSAGSVLDAHFRPNVVDGFDFTIQRQLSRKVLIETGFIARLIHHEFGAINPNAVPYMMTMGGQPFSAAYANVETKLGCVQGQNFCGAAYPQITPSCNAACTLPLQMAYVNGFTPQAFFESSLAGTGYCTGFASCTAAVVFKEEGGNQNFTTQSVWSLWSNLDKGGIGGGPICNTVGGCTNANGTTVNQGQQTTLPGFIFQRSMLNSPIFTSAFGSAGQMSSGIGVGDSYGFGNYNAGFVSLKINDWHSLTLQSNLTLSKALGTQSFVQASSSFTLNDPFDISKNYGVQPFDRRLVYNAFAVYAPKMFLNDHGIKGYALGGWSLSGIFTAGSGAPLFCNTNTDAQAFGAGDGVGFGDSETCIPLSPIAGRSTVYPNGGGTGQPNIFMSQSTAYAQFRAPILGIDTRNAGAGPLHGLPYWNMDVSLTKKFRITERVSADFQFQALNVFNHMQFADPGLSLGDSTGFGTLNSQGNTPRQFEFGAHIKF
jgi:hypothetical protein